MSAITNCTQCNRIFRKVHSPMCPECHQDYMAKVSNVYRFVQDNPLSTLENVAEQCNLPLREVESLFFKGKLGTATTQIIYHCQRCNRPLAANMHKGRFCLNCTEQFETEAGLNESEPVEKPRKTVRGKQDAAPAESKPAATTAAPPPQPIENIEPAASEAESHGFKRLSSESI